MNTKIRGINVVLSDNNSCHKTKDVLKCDLCGKKSKIVCVLQNSTETVVVGFVHDNKKDCFKKAFENMFFGNDDKYVNCCQIEDIDFDDRKENKKRVRAKMTLKLRYEILKRDNFQCVLCGKKPPEVILVVDHIKPVCEGGQSEKDNLRTLCFKCNSGKGGIYD